MNALINIETYLRAYRLQDSPSWLEIKQTIADYEELKRDVKRFIELLMKDDHTGRDTFDIEILKDKLMKVEPTNE